MKIKVKEVTKTVPLLVDPEPGWMALVNHGANQEPWNSLKSDTGERNGRMAKGKAAKRDGVLTRLSFSKEQFKDEAAVKAFVDENGFEGCEIVDEGDIFAAKSTVLDGEDLEKPVSTKTKHAGVTAFIAQRKEPTEDEDDGEEGEKPNTDDKPKGEQEDVTAEPEAKGNEKPAKKGASKAKLVDGKSTTTKGEGDDEDEETDTELKFPANKYDFWGAYMSNEGSLTGVLKDGIDYDGLPPGVDEVISAVYYSTGNVLSSSDDVASKKASLTQIGEDFAALTMGLYELFETATEDSTKSANTERKAKAAAFVKSFSESVTRATKAGDNVIAATTAKGGVTVDITDADDKSEDERLAALIGKAVDAAVKPLAARLEKAEKRNTELETEMSRSTKRRSDQSIIDNLTGGDDDEEEDAETTAKATEATDMVRRMFGVRPRANAG